MANIASCVNGPRLYNVLHLNSNQNSNYSANLLESIPNVTISFMKFCMGFLKWTVLIWMPFIYRKYKNVDSVLSLGKLMCCVATGYWGLFVIRGLGRIVNPVYTDFLLVLQRSQKAPTTENMDLLSQYHFDFSHWPVQFDASSQPRKSKQLARAVPKRPMGLPFFFKPLCYILAHTIGIRMAFPGCTGLINTLVASQRKDRLIQLMQTHNVKRVKLRTADRNDIEAFYKDNRGALHPHGDTLVICCEGNAGFPELGNPKIPLENNYSVIGWNHPGFGGSTGLPFPRHEQHAIDAVMRFALERLAFPVEQVLLFGWSIGGYTASWAAMNYPRVRGLVLDATFDNIDKLAEHSLPILLYPVVLATVREYIDLNVGAQLIEYQGPVRFIIRTHDEIITVEQGVKSSNRGVFLLVEVLRRRYPGLVDAHSLKALWEYLDAPKFTARRILERVVDTDWCEQTLLTSYRASRSRHDNAGADVASNSSSEDGNGGTGGGGGGGLYPLSFPGGLGEADRSQLLIYLASKYMDEFEGTHCTELASSFFVEGWTEAHLEQTGGSGTGSSRSSPRD